MTKGRLLGAVAVVGSLALAAAALRTRKNIWTVSHSLGGFAVQLTEVPAWAELAEDALDVLPCIHPRWDWLFKVGSRRFGTYDDGDPLHTLGGALMSFCDARHSVAFRVEKNVGKVPLTREQALAICPEWVEQCDDIFGDEDERPSKDPL